MKKLLTIMLLVAAGFSAKAQPQFKYKITYNATFCAYEARAVLTSGTFNGTVGTRIPAATTFTIALPAAYSDANFTITSLLPANLTWTEGTGFRAPNARPGFDYHPVSITGGGASNAYPTMNLNDEIVLFRFTLSTIQCGNGIRPYDNGGTPTNDPTSAQFLAAGDAGLNINNAFQISSGSGPLNYYAGNTTSSTAPPGPSITPFTLSISGGQITPGSVAISAGSCATLSTAVFTGPNAYSSSPAVSGSSASVTFSRSATGNLGTYSLTVTNSQGCSTLASSVIALPVKLLYFKGGADKCAAQLSWQIAHGEKDFQGFDLQYSVDGDRYGTVAHLDRNAYNDVYGAAYVQASGKGYYRLKLTDLSGRVGYSETVVVSTDCDNAEITIAPNPTTTTSTVSGIEAGDQVKVADMLGNVIANYVSGGPKATIDLEAFPSGVYSVTVSRGSDILKTAKLTKL